MDRRAAKPLGNSAPVLRNRAEQHAAGDSRRASPRSGERLVLKARDDRRRQLGRPKPGEEVSHHCPGLRLAAARGLQLDIGAEAQLGKKHHRLLQGRHALPGKRRPEPAARVVASDRRERQCADFAAPVGSALEPIVMKQNRLAIGGQANIELDPTAAECSRLAQAGKRILGCAARRRRGGRSPPGGRSRGQPRPKQPDRPAPEPILWPA